MSDMKWIDGQDESVYVTDSGVICGSVKKIGDVRYRATWSVGWETRCATDCATEQQAKIIIENAYKP